MLVQYNNLISYNIIIQYMFDRLIYGRETAAVHMISPAILLQAHEDS